MQVTVVDAAGNSETAPARFFSSYNAGQPGAYAWLDGSMHWHGRRGAAGLTVSYGARPTITGVLLGVDSRPLVGAPVVLSLENDSAFAVRGQATTDAQGHFTLQLPVTHSGEVRVSYGAAALKAFRLDVRAGVTLRASPHSLHNGQRVTFSGRVRSGPIPGAGALVQIQGLNGRRWQEIGTARASAGSGRYRLRFPFANVRRFTRFEFRAKVLREPDYPYATGFSAVRSVLVRP
jgi:hypothetical protein